MNDDTPTLFESLGGAEGVAEVVDEMYQRILADDELAHFFRDADMQRIKRMQTEFISAMIDGPVQYSGAELTEIHRGRGIEERHFSKFCRHVADAIQQRGVAPELLDQVLARLALYSDRITGESNVDG
jgi:hemoglobin